MEIIDTTDGNRKKNIDLNKVDDYIALQLEFQEETIKFYKKYGMYIWAFTLDSKGQGGGFYQLPTEDKDRILFFNNMKEKIEHLTKGAFTLAVNPNFQP